MIAGPEQLAVSTGHEDAFVSHGLAPIFPVDHRVRQAQLEGRGIQHGVLDNLVGNPLEHSATLRKHQLRGELKAIGDEIVQIDVHIPYLRVLGCYGNGAERHKAGDAVLELAIGDEGESQHNMIIGSVSSTLKLCGDIPERSLVFKREGNCGHSVGGDIVKLPPVLFRKRNVGAGSNFDSCVVHANA